MKDRVAIDAVRRDRSMLERALREAGAEVNGRTSIKCPFHTDDHASGRMHQGDDSAWRFTCQANCGWNDGKRTGDAIDVVRRAHQTNFAGALAFFGIDTQVDHRVAGTVRSELVNSTSPTNESSDRITEVETIAHQAVQRLQADNDKLDFLRHDRAVSREVAQKFDVGITEDGRHWAFPVKDLSGRVIAIKHHRTEPTASPKCFWLPKGAPSSHYWPIALDNADPIWLCSGELKALAVASLDRNAIGITCGEGCDLPDGIIDLIGNRPVAIVGDDDEAGRKWADNTLAALKEAGVDARVVGLGLRADDGLNDIGDWIVDKLIVGDKPPEAVRKELDEAYERSDSWAGYSLSAIWEDEQTWTPVEHVGTSFRQFDALVGGGLRTRAVHLFVGKPSRAKTQTVVQIATNAARAGTPTGIISLEFDRREVSQLIMAQTADIPRTWLDKGNVTGEASERFKDAQEQCRQMPLTILDDELWNGALDRVSLDQVIGEGAGRRGWRLVILDYLGLLAPLESDRSDFQIDLSNSAALRRIARKHDIAFVVVASLRKSAGFGNGDKPVSLDDVAGAGRITYDATSIWYVDAAQAPPSTGAQPTGIVKLTPLKSRFSGCASDGSEVQLRWEPGFGSMRDLEGLNDPVLEVCEEVPF